MLDQLNIEETILKHGSGWDVDVDYLTRRLQDIDSTVRRTQVSAVVCRLLCEHKLVWTDDSRLIVGEVQA